MLPPDITPPCRGQSELFDSARPEDQAEARAICATCPLIEACREDYRSMTRHQQLSFTGTWAGSSWGFTRGTWVSGLIAGADLRTDRETCRQCRLRPRRSAYAHHCEQCHAEMLAARVAKANRRRKGYRPCPTCTGLMSKGSTQCKECAKSGRRARAT